MRRGVLGERGRAVKETRPRETRTRKGGGPIALAAAGQRRLVEGTGNPRVTAALAIGDALVFLVFAGVGRSSHHEASGFGALAAVVGTAVPFVLGWFLVAPVVGAYRRANLRSLGAMLGRTLLAWVAAWPVAMALRWIFAPRIAPRDFAIFALVVLATNAVFLGVWRGLFALVMGRRGAERR